jgi:hypothetical protein
MLTLRLLVLTCTVQETNGYSDKLGGFDCRHNSFMVRLTISQVVGQRVEKKIILKNEDILNTVENLVQWTTRKKNILRKVHDP